MPRYARLVFPGLLYHIINRGLEGRKIFRDKFDYLKFLENLLKYKKKFDWIIYCYCLLPNHFHLLIQTKNDPLAKIMKSLQTAYGVFFNKKYKRIGPVFSGRYKSIIVQKDEHFLQASKYIHLNPVKAGLCLKPLDYPYSSYQEYITGNNSLLKENIIDKRAAKRLIGDGRVITRQAIRNYQSFVEEKEDILDYHPGVDIFGDRKFRTQIIKKCKKKG